MAKKASATTNWNNNPPANLDDEPFFGLRLDEDQLKLANAVWSRDKKIYLVDSIAGSGKTTVATALGVMMMRYGFFSKVVYITFPGICEKSQGFLPGTLWEKSEPYFQPLYDALIKIGELPYKICYCADSGSKEEIVDGIECCVSTYMRGINLINSFVILDESQNADLSTLAKVISRASDDCIVMVIGHSGQCDLEDKSQSGFSACIDYQTKYHPEVSQAFNLRTNHRGVISMYADLMLTEYKSPQYGFIYMTKNIETGKLYIGKHKRTMNKEDIDDSWYLGSGTLLRKAINKYGEDNFERTILYDCSSSAQLNYMEQVFINYYNAVDDDTFYNLACGGDGLSTVSEEVRERMRHKHTPMSEEARKNMSRVFSEETKKRLAENTKEKLTGYVHSEESRANMSAGHKGSKSIFKDGIYKYVKESTIQEYLDDGWILRGASYGKKYKTDYWEE